MQYSLHFRRFRKAVIKANVSFVVSIHLSVHMEYKNSHRLDFCEVSYLGFFKLKFVDKLTFWLKSGKTKRHSRSVFPKFCLLADPFCLQKISTDPHILAHVNIECPVHMYPKLKIYISGLIVDRY